MSTEAPNLIIQALILAAGQGQRFGGDKASARLGGRRNLERIASTCAVLGERPALVVTGAYAEFHAGIDWSVPGLEWVVNERWSEGRSSSLKRGLSHERCQRAWVLMWPVDIPLVPAAVLKRLRAELEDDLRAGRSYHLYSPCFEGRGGHPILFSPELSARLMELGPEQSPRPLFRSLKQQRRWLPVDWPEVLWDMDTRADQQALERWLETPGAGG